jgi:hypothetical protein
MKPAISRSFGILIVSILIIPGCRDLNLVNTNGIADGFRIEGTVLDGLEQPMDNIPVSMFYSLEFIGNTPVPVRDYTLESPGEFVNIDVYDGENVLVRNLYAGTPAGATVYVPWDQRRNSGSFVGSGVYTVKVTVGGNLRHSYVELVNGRVTAQTDVNGVFVIPDVHLPVGYSPAPSYNNQGTFTGNYRILNWVYLEFNVGGIVYTYSVPLIAGRVSRVPVRIG